MNFFKALFGGGKQETLEEQKKNEDAKNFDVLKYDGVRALRANQAAYAVQCLTHALQIKDDLEAHDYLSQAYLRVDNAPKAYEQLQILADAQPDNQHILIRMAHVAFMMFDYGAMAANCEKALLLDGNNPEVYWLYAKACIGQDDTSNAVAMLTKAIMLKDDFVDAYLLRGETLLAAGDTNQAAEDAAKVLEAAPENEDILLFNARVQRAEGNADEAVMYYNKVLEANPFRIEAYREIGGIKQAAGDDAGAKECFDKVAELAPQQTADNEQAAAERVKNAYKGADIYGVFSNIIDNS